MLSKKKRVSRKQFQDAFRVGKLSGGPFFSVRVTPSGDFKASIVISKTVEKIASRRVRMRRLWYEALSAYQFRAGTHLFFLKKPANTMSLPEIQKELRAFFGKK